MRKLASLSAIAVTVTLSLFVSTNSAAPALGDKPVKWEYAKLAYKRTVVPDPRAKGGGVGIMTLLWTTEGEEIEGDNWKDLADKLKAPALKKEGSSVQEQLRAMNRLGADGWELVEHEHPAVPHLENWTFKRRAP